MKMAASLSLTHLQAWGLSPLTSKLWCQVGLVEVRSVAHLLIALLEVSEYPDEHTFMVFTSSGDVPKAVNDAISNVAFAGIRVSTLLTKLGSLLDRVTSGTQGHPIDLDDASGGDDESIDDGFEELSPPPGDHHDPDEVMSIDYDDGLGQLDGAARSSQQTAAPRERLTLAAQAARLAQLRHDLKRAKDAGFRATFLGDHADLNQSCFVLISCRVARLGIEDDALKAWGLERQEYIMLLLYFTEGYKSQKDLSSRSTREPKHGLLFHVGVSQKYKVSSSEAMQAFSSLDSKNIHKNTSERPSTPKSQAIRSLFVGPPMNEMLNQRLLLLVEYRMSLGLPWGGAEAFYNDHQGINICSETLDFTPYLRAEDPSFSKNLPNLLKQDEIDNLEVQKSFPLIAMQFTLRHVVRCTDFCLVCHRRTETTFEALKPFVCSKPLCLYQYMQLGFGPSIEYEITTQPYVVDLLISFAWASAQSVAMKELPLGMNLMVPPVNLMSGFPKGSAYLGYGSVPYRNGQVPAPSKPKDTNGTPVLLADFDGRTLALKLKIEPPLKVGTWLVICLKSKKRQHHRIIESLGSGIYRLGSAVVATEHADKGTSADCGSVDGVPYTYPAGLSRGYNRPSSKHTYTQPPTLDAKKTSNAGAEEVQVAVYDHLFDELDKHSQQDALRLVMETLPSVVEMQSYLEAQGDKHMSLRSWTDRISPTALGVLRWIIASNRSCLLQIDNPNNDSAHSEDRVCGMDGYFQFR